jgi:transcriptional regulator with XRE-family HTH domain
MKRRRSRDGASAATVTPAEVGEMIRTERVSRDLRQSDLAELLGVKQSYISQMERGVVDLPGAKVRSKFLKHWGLDPFAERAAERDGKVSASEFSRRTGVDIHSILRLIAEDVLPAHFVGDGLGYDVDERKALAALDALPRCRYEGCDAPATTETGCCGEHAQAQWAVEARGTTRAPEVRQAISDGKIAAGTKRPDKTRWWRKRHAKARAELERIKMAEGLVDASDIAASRGVTRHAIVTGYRAHGLEPVVREIAGQRRLFFRPEDIEAVSWPARGETGRRAWREGGGFAATKVALASRGPWVHWRRVWGGRHHGKAGGGRPRNEKRRDYDEALDRIRVAYSETHASERELERITGESRRMIRTALGRSLGRS